MIGYSKARPKFSFVVSCPLVCQSNTNFTPSPQRINRPKIDQIFGGPGPLSLPARLCLQTYQYITSSKDTSKESISASTFISSD